MTQRRNEIVPITITPVSDDVTNKIFVTINGQDWQKDLTDFALTFDSSENEIMERIAPAIEEEFGQSIKDTYKVRKAINSKNIYVIPSSIAGMQ